MTSSQPDRPYDVVVFGATGFVGRLTAAYLARNASSDLRIALAGRSRDRLESARAELPAAAGDWPLLVADSTDRSSLDELAGSARVVVTTVGPYLKYGLPLVEACAAAGTHYADLTGEVLFVRRSIDAAHESAARTGARIVHSCGFDSVPSDLGALLVAHQAQEDRAGELTDAVLLAVSLRGGVSGGTVDSLRGVISEARSSATARRLLLDPYALSPDRESEPDLGAQSDAFVAHREPLLDGQWVAPFIMASHNTRIVRRSNALTGWSFGKQLRYREALNVGGGPLAPVKAAAVAGAVGSLATGLALPPTRILLDRVLPSPGEGPDEEARAKGHFTTTTTAVTTSGARYRATVKAQGDPGYAATAVMLGESALALASDDLPGEGGVLTPATGIGLPLADRLRSAGFTVDVERLD